MGVCEVALLISVLAKDHLGRVTASSGRTGEAVYRTVMRAAVPCAEVAVSVLGGGYGRNCPARGPILQNGGRGGRVTVHGTKRDGQALITRAIQTSQLRRQGAVISPRRVTFSGGPKA